MTQMFIMFRFEGMNTVILHTRCTYKKDWWQWHILNFECMIFICHVHMNNMTHHQTSLIIGCVWRPPSLAKWCHRPSVPTDETSWEASAIHPSFRIMGTTEINFWITTSTKKHRDVSKNQLACFNFSKWFEGRWWEGGNSETNATMGGTVSGPGWVWWRVDQRFWRWTSNSDYIL